MFTWVRKVHPEKNSVEYELSPIAGLYSGFIWTLLDDRGEELPFYGARIYEGRKPRNIYLDKNKIGSSFKTVEDAMSAVESHIEKNLRTLFDCLRQLTNNQLGIPLERTIIKE